LNFAEYLKVSEEAEFGYPVAYRGWGEGAAQPCLPLAGVITWSLKCQQIPGIERCRNGFFHSIVTILRWKSSMRTEEEQIDVARG
jgi:hypothetical protein